MVAAASYIIGFVCDSDVIAMIMIGASAGFTFRYDGLFGMLAGN